MPDSREELEAVVQRLSEQGGDTPERVDRIIALIQAMNTEDPERILRLAEEAGQISRRIGYAAGEAYAAGYAGFGHYLLSDHEVAYRHFQESIAQFEALGDVTGLAMSLSGLASVHMSVGEFERSMESALRALKIFRETGNRQEEAWTLHGFGTGYADLGDDGRALDSFRQALVIFKETGDIVGEARALNGIGTMLQKQGAYAEAASNQQQSLSLFREAGNRIGEARAVHDLGLIHYHLDDHPQALAYLREGLAIREAIGNRQSQCTSLIALGRVYLALDDAEQARAVLDRALALAEAIRAKPRIYQAHEALADVHERLGDLARALAHQRAYQQVKEDVMGEQALTAMANLRVGFAVERAQQEAEIERLRNVELRAKNDELARLLGELQAAQAQLVQAEKLASLGQLTAGIAHEIKNPLNFVNNFADLTVDLVEDLTAVLAAAPDEPVSALQDEVGEILDDLTFNARKIAEHGRRADGIVQSMLLHSRGRPGDRRRVDLNVLLTEYINLAYHGMRAQQPAFNVTLERSLDPDVGEVEVVPQELGRVLLNVLNNAFYAVHERAMQEEADYAPTVRVTSRRDGSSVVIDIADNGPGIAAADREKIFDPFFSTKPTGEGTGLGLSLSYDIVTQVHNGTLAVADAPGGGAAFTITLPAFPGAALASAEDE